MARIEFVIEGKPAPQERPYVTRFGTFDRPKSKARKAEIALVARSEARIQKWKIAQEHVGIFLLFKNPNMRADIDNLTKLVLDALSGVLWKDDSLVIKLFAEKALLDGPASTSIIVWNYEKKEFKL